MTYEDSELNKVKALLTHDTEAGKRKKVLLYGEDKYKNGFYAGQAMAGVELEDCHNNWRKHNLPVTNAKSNMEDE